MTTEAPPEIDPSPPASTTGSRPPASFPLSTRLRAGPRRHAAIGVAALLLLLVGGLAARAWWPEPKVDIRAGTALVDNDGLAARHGIKINLIAVTAGGGIIDFRYQVTDPDKASRIIHEPELYPRLIVEETGETLGIGAPAHSHGAQLLLGGTYFFLLANAQNAVHPGSLLTVVVGDARVEHVAVQG